MKKSSQKNTSGYALVIVMVAVFILTLYAGIAFEYSMQSLRSAQRQSAQDQAIVAANGALNSAFVQWRSMCQSYQNIPIPASYLTLATPSFPIVDSGQPGGYINSPSITNFSLSAVNSTDPTLAPIVSTTAFIAGAARILDSPYATYDYLAEADVSYERLSSTNNTVKVFRNFQKSLFTPWQYGIFYNDDLEINPGSHGALSVTGATQTNGNLYTGGDGSANYLTLGGKTTFAAVWDSSGGWSPNDTVHAGTCYPPNFTLQPAFGSWAFPLDYNSLNIAENAAIASNPNTASGYREIIERPRSGYSDPLAPGSGADAAVPTQRLYNQAGVKLLVTTNIPNPALTAVAIYNGSDGQVTAASTGTNAIIYNTFKSALTTNLNMRDSREGTNITLTCLDISKITDALNTTLAGSGCNIVYISDTTANGGISVLGTNNPGMGSPANRGIKLINGYNMPTGGLTIVSDNPVYIQGNYNTSRHPWDYVPSNDIVSNPSKPYAGWYTVKPCAVIADAVTILSNAWLDSNSTLGLASCNASNTTVNTAIMSGIIPSGTYTIGTYTNTSKYSGGVENFLRLLENWSNKALTFHGSMVELYQSQQATQPWQASGVYFNTPGLQQYYASIQYQQPTPPPGVLILVSYKKGRWFTQ